MLISQKIEETKYGWSTEKYTFISQKNQRCEIYIYSNLMTEYHQWFYCISAPFIIWPVIITFPPPSQRTFHFDFRFLIILVTVFFNIYFLLKLIWQNKVLVSNPVSSIVFLYHHDQIVFNRSWSISHVCFFRLKLRVGKFGLKYLLKYSLLNNSTRHNVTGENCLFIREIFRQIWRV